MKNTITKTLKASLLIGALLFVGLFSSAYAQSSGTLSLSPGTGIYTAGDFFTVRVLTNTGGGPINAAEGVINFNGSELQVINVNDAGSIFNLWVTEPEFSNSAGTITFAGGSPKGYTGASGQVFSITFKALTEGISNVTWRSGVMTAADGKGTNILSNMAGGKYTITAKDTTPPPEIVVPPNTPAAPKVTSPTHPDPNKWYTSKDVEFNWSVPSGVTNVRLTADQKSGTIPAVFYDTPITGKTLDDFDEGAWYLHVQFRNENGWGRVAHFPFNIDATEPESFTITQVTEIDPEDPRLGFLFEAVDNESGVEDYEITIDNNEPFMWKDDGSHIYKVDTLEPGSHTMFVRALDKSGNSIAESITFTVASLDAPIITDYPEVLNSGGILVIRGVALPESDVAIYLGQKGDDADVFNVKADDQGAFTFIMDEKPQDGIYSLWAIATDVRGSISSPSEKVTIAVRPGGFLKIGSLAISYLSIIVPLLALLILAVLLLLYGIRKVKDYRAVVRKEATEAEEVLHESFTQLHFEVQQHVKKLETARRKRALTKEEAAMVKNLNAQLDEAEKIVGKEIRDIKRVS